MALDKKEVSLDLVKGADTKVNPQIDQDYQAMENVVFTGDMTAKKMDGYDLLGSLPASENYSLLARRQNDLIAQSDKGTYKYLPTFSAFKKISEIGSSEVISKEMPGYSFKFSTNYRCFVKYEGTTSQSRMIVSFFDHDGVLINSASFGTSGTVPGLMISTTKVLSNGDDFYVCNSFNSLGNVYIYIAKYSLDIGLLEFVKTDSIFIDTGFTFLVGLDYMCDGNYIFMINGYQTFRVSTSLTGKIGSTISESPLANVELFDFDATYFLASVSDTAAMPAVKNILVKIRKSDLAEISSTVLATVNATSNGAGGWNVPVFACYPTSATTGISAVFRKYPGVSGLRQNTPIGRVFKRNNNYYVPVFQYCGNNIATVIMLLKNVTSSYYDIYAPVGISDTGAIPNLSIQDRFSEGVGTLCDISTYDGVDYFPSITPANLPIMVGFNSNASLVNNYIEIDKSLIISNGMPAYFDGESFAEYGFIGNPYMSDFTIGTGGHLPADSGYQFAAIMSWTDAHGNIFYSPLAQTYSAFDPVNGITLLANAKMSFTVQAMVITRKPSFNVELYIKRKNKLFQLSSTTLFTLADTTSNGLLGFDVVIDTYPSSTAKIMPYQDGSIAPEAITNSSAISLYTDRVFRISKDNPISLAYSQKKLADNGFEFNDSFLYLDVLDKKGIDEDDLSGSISLDGRLIIFKRNSILYIVGSGPSRANTQDDFSEPQLIASDVGCTETRSIILVPDGIMFKSDKGIYLLNRKLQTSYIGSSVELFNSNTITSAIMIENSNEIRFTTLEGQVLVFNYLSNAWSWFNDINSLSACLWSNSYLILKTNGDVLIETSAHKKLINAPIIQKIAIPWVKVDRAQGWEKAYEVRILGYYKTPHRLIMKVFYDYELYASEEYIIDPLASNQYNITTRPTNEAIENGTAINGVYQIRIDLIRKNCQAFRIEITDLPINPESNTGECFALSNINLTVGIKKGAAKIQALKSY